MTEKALLRQYALRLLSKLVSSRLRSGSKECQQNGGDEQDKLHRTPPNLGCFRSPFILRCPRLLSLPHEFAVPPRSGAPVTPSAQVNRAGTHAEPVSFDPHLLKN